MGHREAIKARKPTDIRRTSNPVELSYYQTIGRIQNIANADRAGKIELIQNKFTNFTIMKHYQGDHITELIEQINL